MSSKVGKSQRPVSSTRAMNSGITEHPRREYSPSLSSFGCHLRNAVTGISEGPGVLRFTLPLPQKRPGPFVTYSISEVAGDSVSSSRRTHGVAKIPIHERRRRAIRGDRIIERDGVMEFLCEDKREQVSNPRISESVYIV